MAKCPNCGVELILKMQEQLAEANKHPSVDRVRVALGDNAKLMEFSTGDGKIVIRPIKWLGKEGFARVAEELKQFDARYVSEGKNSRWEI